MDILASESNIQRSDMFTDKKDSNNLMNTSKKPVAESLLLLGLDIKDNNLPLTEIYDNIFNNEEKITHLEPIIDIVVIKSNEQPPSGYRQLNRSYMGSDIFNKTFFFRKRINSIVCFQTGNSKLPIIDIKLINYSESAPPGYTVIARTESGCDACLNHAASAEGSLYLAYKRASYPAKYAIVDMCITRTDNNEPFPHTYYKIEPKITSGLAYVSPQFQFLYKRSCIRSPKYCCRAEVLSYYPQPYQSNQLPDINTLSKFCLPNGIIFDIAMISSVPTVDLFTTSLTDPVGNKIYATCYIFYEILDDSHIPNTLKEEVNEYRVSGVNAVVYVSKCLCLLSKEANFKLNHQFLSTLHRFTLSMTQHMPMERLIVYFMKFVGKPTVSRPKVIFNFAVTPCELLHNPFDGLLPSSGASFLFTLFLFDVEELIELTACVLLERKILVHCHKVNRIMPIVECLSMIIYPFEWQCPYVPFCPLDLADVVTAPMPFIAGISTEYFDHHIPADDITCIDLSNDHIRFGKEINFYIPEIFEVLRENLFLLKRRLAEEYEQNENFIETMEAESRMKWELSIQYEFVKFISTIMLNYKKFLRVNTPLNKSSIDVNNIFDVKGFIQSKNLSDRQFFQLITKTQYFSHFITQCYKHYRCEIGMLSVNNIMFLNDFIDNISKGTMNKRWLQSKINVLDEQPVVLYPEISFFNYDYGYPFKYGSYFPKFDIKLLEMEEKILLESNPCGNSICANHIQDNHFKYVSENSLLNLPLKEQYIHLVVRNKMQKEKAYQQALNSFNDLTKLHWPIVVLSHVFCCWFICLLPMYHYCQIVINEKANIFGNEIRISVINELTKYSLYIVRKMGKLGCITSNEIYPRVIAKLCSFCESGDLAKKALNYMSDHGIPIDAVAGSIFEYTMKKAVEHGKKPSSAASLENSNYQMPLIDTVSIRKNFSLHKKSNSISPRNFINNPNYCESPIKNQQLPLECSPKSDIDVTIEDSTSEGFSKIFSAITLNDFSSIDIHHDYPQSKNQYISTESIYQYADPQKWFMSLSGVTKFIDLDAVTSQPPFKNLINDSDIDINSIASLENTNSIKKVDPSNESYSDKPLLVHLSCSMECQFCSQILFDEDIMSGWSFNDSNFNFLCPYCSNKKAYQTANLHVHIFEQEISTDSIEAEKYTLSSNSNPNEDTKINMMNSILMKNVVYISPLTLRKELECTVEQNGITFLMSSCFPEKYPLLFWNLLWIFQRKSIKSHLILLLASYLKRSYKSKINVYTSWEHCPEELNPYRPIKILLSSDIIFSSLFNENPFGFVERTVSNIKKALSDGSIKKMLKLMHLLLEHQTANNIPISWNIYSEALHILSLWDRIKSDTIKLDIDEYEKIYTNFYQKYCKKNNILLKKYMEPSSFCAIKFRKLFSPLKIRLNWQHNWSPS